MGGIRTVHDFTTVAAPAPFQIAGITALGLPASYYESMRADYSARRDTMVRVLDENGLSTAPPQGAYYMMVDISHLGLGDDVQTARHLVEEVGVATVPGSSFFSRAELGRTEVWIAFCKKLETLEAAGQRLKELTAR
jgi:aspartate/methionine/tyrosine aminotransferase